MYLTINRPDNVINVNYLNLRPFEIQIDLLQGTRNEKDLTNCCDLFIHLKETKLSDDDDPSLFYELAKFVNEEYSDHNIDWVNTFVALGQLAYGKYIKPIDANNIEAEDVLSNVDITLNDDVELNEEFSKTEVRNGFFSQVNATLKAKGII